MAGAGGSCDREGNVRWPTIGAGATVAADNHLAAAKAATGKAAVTEVTTRWVRLEATCGDPTEEQWEKDQTMPGDRCRSRWFRRQRRQRTGAVGSGCRHQMAAVGFGEEEEHSLRCWHRSVGSAWQGRKKGHRSGNRLEEVATAAGGRCWDGKEQLAGDHIQSRSSREVGRADGHSRNTVGPDCSNTTKEGDDEEDGRPGRWTSEGYHWYRKRASAVDSIMSGACLLLERETYIDEERVTLRAEDVQESGDG
ncbi:hypothetical protein B296_00033252 [Ensete ventricosum]|uniref:Uncharacterized protein n=1 Tax=Ensete ventricosum TaxID=4639 RepID=A0A426XF17_ENSVE|nr:hypothetical protein B296_00033252 [Ensete ventricosum]